MNWQEYNRLLLEGDYDNGWPPHEAIVSGSAEAGLRYAATFDKPVWTGKNEPITLLVNAEFGDGDTIQFWRFIEQAKQRVSKVILRCDRGLFDLFQNVQLNDKFGPLPSFDKVIHMMALPRVLGVKKADIKGQAYLSPNDSIKRLDTDDLFRHSLFKVGICWAGNPFNPRDRVRSIPESVFTSLALHYLTVYNLTWLYPSTSRKFVEVNQYMPDWNRTAQLLNQIDLVVTVDTAIAHLAAAIGKPTWVLLPTHDPDWRWGLEGDRTVWYDSMRLYRRGDSWDATMAHVINDLKAHLFDSASFS